MIQNRMSLFIVIFLLNLNYGCGVKGRPLPPEYPPYIGHGLNGSSEENVSTPQVKEEVKTTEIKEATPNNENPLTEIPKNIKTPEETKKKKSTNNIKK